VFAGLRSLGCDEGTAMIELNDELRHALVEHAGNPVPLVDPETHETFVLVRSEVYERLTRLVYDDSELLIPETYPLQDKMAAEAGWDDPAMDIYNDLAPKEPK
jgi:hypothetical protein